MAEFVPQLSDVVDFHIGEHPRIEDEEIPLIWLVTFLKPNVPIIANSIGLYLKRIDGDVNGMDIMANIYAYDPFWTVEPETPGIGQEVMTLASNVDLSLRQTVPTSS